MYNFYNKKYKGKSYNFLMDLNNYINVIFLKFKCLLGELVLVVRGGWFIGWMDVC